MALWVICHKILYSKNQFLDFRPPGGVLKIKKSKLCLNRWMATDVGQVVCQSQSCTSKSDKMREFLVKSSKIPIFACMLTSLVKWKTSFSQGRWADWTGCVRYHVRGHWNGHPLECFVLCGWNIDVHTSFYVGVEMFLLHIEPDIFCK